MRQQDPHNRVSVQSTTIHERQSRVSRGCEWLEVALENFPQIFAYLRYVQNGPAALPCLAHPGQRLNIGSLTIEAQRLPTGGRGLSFAPYRTYTGGGGMNHQV